MWLIRAGSSVQSKSLNRRTYALEESAMRDGCRHYNESQDLQGKCEIKCELPWTSKQTIRVAFVRATTRVMRNINLQKLMLSCTP